MVQEVLWHRGRRVDRSARSTTASRCVQVRGTTSRTAYPPPPVASHRPPDAFVRHHGHAEQGLRGMRFLGFPIFEGLVAFDLRKFDRSGQLEPGLAEKWEQDPDDKKAWIFNLRKGVKFHDGTDFNPMR